MIRTTFQLLGDATYVEKIFVGTENCTDPGFVGSIVMVVESLGTFQIDYSAMENDSFPITFAPEQTFTSPEPETIPSPEPGTPLSPQPETVPQPFIFLSPQPETEPQPSTAIPVPFGAEPLQEPEPSTLQEPEPSTLEIPQKPLSSFSVWLPFILTPLKFQITIVSEKNDIFYTNDKNGPCMPIINYWQDPIVGCPCNGTWVAAGSVDPDTDTIVGGREIQPNLCPNSTCPETLFINETVRYGKVRINQTVYEDGTVGKTAEITQMSSIKEIGYAFGEEDIMFVFIVPNKNTTTNPDQTPSPGASSPQVVILPGPLPAADPDPNDTGSGSSPIPLATTITMMFVFLLMLYENTQ
jgi:hypothetical protein